MVAACGRATWAPAWVPGRPGGKGYSSAPPASPDHDSSLRVVKGGAGGAPPGDLSGRAGPPARSSDAASAARAFSAPSAPSAAASAASCSPPSRLDWRETLVAASGAFEAYYDPGASSALALADAAPNGGKVVYVDPAFFVSSCRGVATLEIEGVREGGRGEGEGGGRSLGCVAGAKSGERGCEKGAGEQGQKVQGAGAGREESGRGARGTWEEGSERETWREASGATGGIAAPKGDEKPSRSDVLVSPLLRWSSGYRVDVTVGSSYAVAEASDADLLERGRRGAAEEAGGGGSGEARHASPSTSPPCFRSTSSASPARSDPPSSSSSSFPSLPPSPPLPPPPPPTPRPPLSLFRLPSLWLLSSLDSTGSLESLPGLPPLSSLPSPEPVSRLQASVASICDAFPSSLSASLPESLKRTLRGPFSYSLPSAFPSTSLPSLPSFPSLASLSSASFPSLPSLPSFSAPPLPGVSPSAREDVLFVRSLDLPCTVRVSRLGAFGAKAEEVARGEFALRDVLGIREDGAGGGPAPEPGERGAPPFRDDASDLRESDRAVTLTIPGVRPKEAVEGGAKRVEESGTQPPSILSDPQSRRSSTPSPAPPSSPPLSVTLRVRYAPAASLLAPPAEGSESETSPPSTASTSCSKGWADSLDSPLEAASRLFEEWKSKAGKRERERGIAEAPEPTTDGKRARNEVDGGAEAAADDGGAETGGGGRARGSRSASPPPSPSRFSALLSPFSPLALAPSPYLPSDLYKAMFGPRSLPLASLSDPFDSGPWREIREMAGYFERWSPAYGAESGAASGAPFDPLAALLPVPLSAQRLPAGRTPPLLGLGALRARGDVEGDREGRTGEGWAERGREPARRAEGGARPEELAPAPAPGAAEGAKSAWWQWDWGDGGADDGGKRVVDDKTSWSDRTDASPSLAHSKPSPSSTESPAFSSSSSPSASPIGAFPRLPSPPAPRRSPRPAAFLRCNRTGTEAWLSIDEPSRTLMLAFRGTQGNEWQDVVTDASFAPVEVDMDRLARVGAGESLDAVRLPKLHERGGGVGGGAGDEGGEGVGDEVAAAVKDWGQRFERAYEQGEEKGARGEEREGDAGGPSPAPARASSPLPPPPSLSSLPTPPSLDEMLSVFAESSSKPGEAIRTLVVGFWDAWRAWTNDGKIGGAKRTGRVDGARAEGSPRTEAFGQGDRTVVERGAWREIAHDTYADASDGADASSPTPPPPSSSRWLLGLPPLQQTPPPPAPPRAFVHYGFLRAYESIRPTLLQCLESMAVAAHERETKEARGHDGAPAPTDPSAPPAGAKSGARAGANAPRTGVAEAVGARDGAGGAERTFAAPDSSASASRSAPSAASASRSAPSAASASRSAPSAAAPWRVIVTGHSLGGALAALCAADLSTRDWAHFDVPMAPLLITLYTFGCPRVGDREFAAWLDAKVERHWRVVNGPDAVASIPRLIGYAHGGRLVQLHDDEKGGGVWIQGEDEDAREGGGKGGGRHSTQPAPPHAPLPLAPMASHADSPPPLFRHQAPPAPPPLPLRLDSSQGLSLPDLLPTVAALAAVLAPGAAAKALEAVDGWIDRVGIARAAAWLGVDLSTPGRAAEAARRADEEVLSDGAARVGLDPSGAARLKSRLEEEWRAEVAAWQRLLDVDNIGQHMEEQYTRALLQAAAARLRKRRESERDEGGGR